MGSNHKLKALFLTLALIAGIFIFERYNNDIVKTIPKAEKAAIDFAAGQIKKEIAAPPPLRLGPSSLPLSGQSAAPSGVQAGTLTKSGVILQTNKERSVNGHATLTENSLLDESAAIKADDLFSKQYFEHISPSGVGPANLADKVGYEYLMIGENLALGGFTGNVDLVTAWMNSPGHRANILNAKYTEIGVAVKQGMFEGKMVWIGVQEFGRPLALCPGPDKSLQASVDAQKIQLDSMQAQIAALKADIDQTSQSSPEYNQKVDRYNALVREYDNLAASTKTLIDEYNNEVKSFNACAAA